MFVQRAFVLFFSEVIILKTGPLLSGFSKLDCAFMCSETKGCSSFFYKSSGTLCMTSSTRYLGKDQLVYGQGFQYYIMRPDCGAGWTEAAGQCYLLRLLKKNHMEAQKSCEKHGGFLARVDSVGDEKIIKSFLPHYRTSVWIGGEKDGRYFHFGTGSGETWRWKDGSTITLDCWKPGAPDNKGIFGENCMEQTYWGLNDVSCGGENYYVCEK